MWGGGVWEEVLQGRGEAVVVGVVRLVVWALVRSTWLYSGGEFVSVWWLWVAGWRVKSRGG